MVMKKFFVHFALLLSLGMGVALATPADTYAANIVENASSCGNGTAFFSLRPWYQGLTTSVNSKCEIGKPIEGKMPEFVWTIVLNILYDVMVMVGYLAIIMIAWGGYLYMFSRGMPDRAERGKKTLIAAVAGLAVAMLASVIMNTVVAILTQTS